MDKLLIFGRGNYCRLKYGSIKKDYEIIGFLDNAVMDEDFDEQYGIPIYNPCRVHEFGDCHVMCMSAAYIDMWRQLRNLGVGNDKILFGIAIRPFYSVADEECFKDGQQLVSQGDSIVYRTKDLREYVFKTDNELRSILRKVCAAEHDEISMISKMDVKPVSRCYGLERGRAVDRYYIERFLSQNMAFIKGAVMEVASNDYIRKFGGDKVEKELILHVKGWGKNAFKGNFETGEGIEEGMADCLICTQTLQYIYDLKAAMRNIHKLLKSNGTALITVPGIKSLCIPDEKNWGERWSFTEESMRQLCREVCGEEDYTVESFGNVKIATAYLYGLCCEDLMEEDFQYYDPQFPFLITVKIRKQ